MRITSMITGCVLLSGLAAEVAGQTMPVQPAIDAARAGGVIVVCRHGITDSADENEQTLSYADPSTQRRLSPAGERQAEALGKAFRELRIPAGEVVASPMQRARRTGELMFGRVTLDSSWHTRGEDYSGTKKDRRLSMLSASVPEGNRIIFSHIGTIYSVLPSIQGKLEEGDCAVVRPAGSSFTVVGVVPWRAWTEAVARRK